jgi:hypothetical protein
MSNYKISKTHRNILERAIEPHSKDLVLKFINDDFVSIRCKHSDRVLATAHVCKERNCNTSTDGLVALIGDLMFWSSRCMLRIEREDETEQ